MIMVCKTQLTIRENKNNDIKRNIQKHNQSWIVYVKAQFCLFNGTKEYVYRSEPGPRAMIQPVFLAYQGERKICLDWFPIRCYLSLSIQACSPDVVKEATSPHLEVNL